MTKEDRVQNVYWCDTCRTTSVVTNEWISCGFCNGEVEEIGWIEETK